MPRLPLSVPQHCYNNDMVLLSPSAWRLASAFMLLLSSPQVGDFKISFTYAGKDGQQVSLHMVGTNLLLQYSTVHYTYICTYLLAYVRTYVHTHMYIRTYIHTNVRHTRVHLYIRTYCLQCICICEVVLYVRKCTYLYECMYCPTCTV